VCNMVWTLIEPDGYSEASHSQQAPFNQKKKKVLELLKNYTKWKDSKSDNTRGFKALSHIDLSPVLRSRAYDEGCIYANDPNIKCFHTSRRRSSVGDIPP
jgi:hypothetical protein